MSIFMGKAALRHHYAALTFTQLAAANSKANAVLLHTFKISGRLTFFDNWTDVEMAVWLVHPEADPSDNDYRLLLVEVSPNQVLNYSVGGVPGIEIESGTRVYCSWTGVAAPTAGKFKIAIWG